MERRSSKKIKEQKAITLIALVITIVVLLILASVSIAMLTGENGLLTKATNAREKNKEAEAKEKVGLILQEYAIPKYTENANFEKFLIEKKKTKEIDEYERGQNDIWTIELDGYAFDVNEKTLKIENYGKAGLRPKASINIITQGYVLEGNNVQFNIEITLPTELEGATTTISDPPSGVTKTGDTYSASQNGSYEFEIKANKDGKEYKTKAIATINQILGKPTISITNQLSTGFTINVTSDYPQDANIQYVYYVGESETEKTNNKTYAKDGLNSGKRYSVKVRAYISDTVYIDSDDVQAETKGTEIRTVEDLQNIANDMAGGYQLMNDIDLAGVQWTMIGGSNATFTGTLDGNGHVIKNLTTTEAAGLFHEIKNATIKNLGLENFTVSGFFASPLAYEATGSTYVGCCYSTGDALETNGVGFCTFIKGTSLFENLWSSVNCGRVGAGIAGAAGEGGSPVIKNCYSIGQINSEESGGITRYSISVENSYYNKEIFPYSYNIAGAMGYTTDQMKIQSNYNNWDFDNVWYMDQKSGYPKLRVFLNK